MGKTFIAKFNCDNAAFDVADYEISRILREMADNIEDHGAPNAYKTIYDVNGNDVGRYALKPTGEGYPPL